MSGKRTDEQYLRETWWQDRDVSVRAHKLRMVTTRSPHSCPSNGPGEAHEIPAGTRALYETGIFDGEWVQCWLCAECMDRWMDFVEGKVDSYSEVKR